MANKARLNVPMNSKIKITQKGATHNRVVAKVPRNTRIRIKKS